MPESRLPRNVFVYDAHVPDGIEPILVGGMYQFGPTTGAEFYFCLEFCFRFPRPSNFRLMAANSTILLRDAIPVPMGTYTVVSISISAQAFPLINVLDDPVEYVSVTLTDDFVRPRTISGGSPGTLGVYPFSRDVDEGCTFSGT